MTYTGQSGSSDEGSALWTNEANWAGANDPGRIRLRNWEDDLGISTPEAEPTGSGAVTVHEKKYLDVRLSEKHGIPIYTRLESGARRNVVPAGYVFGRRRQDLYKSPASSSSSYQQNGGAGGTRPDMVKPAFGNTPLRQRRGGACPSGYGLQQVKTRWGKKYMCVLPKRERSKDFDAEIL